MDTAGPGMLGTRAETNIHTYIYKIYHNISNKSLEDEHLRKIKKKLWKLNFLIPWNISSCSHKIHVKNKGK